MKRTVRGILQFSVAKQEETRNYFYALLKSLEEAAIVPSQLLREEKKTKMKNVLLFFFKIERLPLAH